MLFFLTNVLKRVLLTVIYVLLHACNELRLIQRFLFFRRNVYFPKDSH